MMDLMLPALLDVAVTIVLLLVAMADTDRREGWAHGRIPILQPRTAWTGHRSAPSLMPPVHPG